MKQLYACTLLICLTLFAFADRADAQRRGGGGARGGGFRGGGGGGGFRGGGGGGFSRGGARTSVTRPSRPSGGFSRPSTPNAGLSRPSTPNAGLSRPSAPTASRPSVSQPATRPSLGAGQQPSTRPSVGAGGNAGANRPGAGTNPGGGRNNVANRPSNQPSNRPGGDRTNIGNGDRPINIQDNDVNIGGGDWDHGHGCCYGWGAAAAGFVAGAWAGAVIGSTVYALPPSCPLTVVGGVTYNYCGGTWYQPQFQGTETTYIVVESPPGAPQDTAQPAPAPSPPR
jgi:hypothetical protein